MNLATINAIGFCTVVRKEIKKNIVLWKMVLLPPVLTALLYFLIFGTVIGHRIGLIQGYSYIDFILPGLIMMTVINSAYAQSSFSFFIEKFQHSLDELLVSPMHHFVIVLSFVVSAVFRGVLVGFLVMLVGFFFTPVSISHWALMILSMVLAAMLFAALGLINGIYARNFDDVNMVPTFVLTPMTYLGGVFYSVNDLPHFWQDLSYINPIAYIIQVFRYSMLNTQGIHWQMALLIMGVLVLLSLLLANYLMLNSRKLRA